MKLQTEKRLPQWRRLLQKQMDDPIRRFWIELAGSFLVGFCLSAASLGNVPLPLCMAALCAGGAGWPSMAFALGGGLGYGLFWEQAGIQGLLWIAGALPICVFLSEEKRKMPFLVPSMGALIVAATGLGFQLWMGDTLSVALYLLRVVLAFGVTCLAQMLHHRRSPMTVAMAWGIAVLSLAQIAPVDFLNLGFVAAGSMGLLASFPTVTLSGLALDLAGVTPVPMTAVLCLTYFAGKVSFLPKRVKVLLPALLYLAVMGLCGQSQWLPLPALVVGGLGYLLPLEEGKKQSRSLEGHIQSRLDTVSAVLAQTRRLLQESVEYPLDEGALILRSAQRACDHCDKRKNCHSVERARFLPQALLHQSCITVDNIPQDCKRKERLLAELQRSQELYRLLLADRQRQQEYRSAVVQQYGFLAEYLRELADDLPRWGTDPVPRFQPEVAACSRGREAVNGDRCCWFPGPKGKYYVLLCDGMGTGNEAAYEARIGAGQLRRMLIAGYPAHEAMQSLNSLCILRSCAGAVTVDLAEADLQTGRVSVYKWGAAPSWLMCSGNVEKIGRESPPPGISLEEGEETVDKLMLQPGAALVMVSDGVDIQTALNIQAEDYDQPAGFLAAMILEAGVSDVPDDATAVVLRLHRLEN